MLAASALTFSHHTPSATARSVTGFIKKVILNLVLQNFPLENLLNPLNYLRRMFKSIQ